MTEPANRTELMLAYLCIATEIESSLARKIEILERFDLLNKDIALICGCKPQAVADARQRLKKTKKK